MISQEYCFTPIQNLSNISKVNTRKSWASMTESKGTKDIQTQSSSQAHRFRKGHFQAGKWGPKNLTWPQLILRRMYRMQIENFSKECCQVKMPKSQKQSGSSKSFLSRIVNTER